jgi:ABC-type iron transport system FetAB ATPase subunit
LPAQSPASDSAGNSGLSIRGLKSELAGPFSLDAPLGTCAAVTGPSGSGKSLFLRMIADLDVNDGEVALNGRARQSYAPPQWRRSVSYVAAEAGWWADRVADHFPPERLSRARELAGLLGLGSDLINGPVARLSSGERQRLAIVRAVVLEPSVLLLDEPTGALDQGSTGKVEQLIRTLLGEGKAVIMVTHDEPLGERLATARYAMADRRLIAR